MLGSKNLRQTLCKTFFVFLFFPLSQRDPIVLRYFEFSLDVPKLFTVVKASSTVASSRETKRVAAAEEGKAPNLRKCRFCSNFLLLRATCPSRCYYKNMWDYNLTKVHSFARCNLCYFIVFIYTHSLLHIFNLNVTWHNEQKETTLFYIYDIAYI